MAANAPIYGQPAVISPVRSLWRASARRPAYWRRSGACRSHRRAAPVFALLAVSLAPFAARRTSGSPFPSTSDPPSVVDVQRQRRARSRSSPLRQRRRRLIMGDQDKRSCANGDLRGRPSKQRRHNAGNGEPARTGNRDRAPPAAGLGRRGALDHAAGRALVRGFWPVTPGGEPVGLLGAGGAAGMAAIVGRKLVRS